MIAWVTYSLYTIGGKFSYRLKECPSIVRIGYFLFLVFGGIIVSVVTNIVRIRGIVVCILPFILILFVGGVITLICLKILWLPLDSIGWYLWLPAPPLSGGPIINCTRTLFIHRNIRIILVAIGVFYRCGRT